jgi:hypothetical protein
MTDERGEELAAFECAGVSARRYLSKRAFGTLVGLGFFSLFFLAEAIQRWSALAALLALLCIAYGARVWDVERSRGRGPARALRIDDALVRFGARSIPRSAVADATIVLDDDLVPVLRLEVGRNLRRTFELLMPNLQAARDALATLGFDATRVASRFEVLATPRAAWELAWLRSFAVLFGVLVVLAGTKALVPRLGLGLSPRWLEALSLFAAGAAWVTAVLPLFARRQLTIGNDGVHVAWRDHARFASASSIREARVVEEDLAMGLRAVVLRLYVRDGEPLELVVGVKPRGLSLAPALALAATAQERIERVRADDPTAERAEAPVALLRRPSGSLDAWLAALRQQLRRPDTFREDVGELSRRLWSVAEDPRGAPDDRAAAAIALGPTLDAGGKERLGALGPTTAVPALRAAFEAAAEGDERAMRRALAALQAERGEGSEMVGESEGDDAATRRRR